MRLLIIANDGLSAEGLRRELKHTPGFEVVGYANGRADATAAVALAAPEVVVIDEMDGGPLVLRRIREARDAVPAAKLVLVTSTMTERWLSDAAGAGVDAAVKKSLRPSFLGAFVQQVVAGNVFHAFATPAVEPAAAAEEAGLTHRELEVLRLVAAGLSNARIAKALWVPEGTVKFHLSNTYRKLGVKSRTAASHCAHVRRLVESPPGNALPAAA